MRLIIYTHAQSFYQSLGFHVVGEITNYLVQGHSEILMRKTIGPRSGFSPAAGARKNPAGT